MLLLLLPALLALLLRARRAVLSVFSMDSTHLEPNLRPTPRSHAEYGQSGRSIISSQRTLVVAEDNEEVVDGVVEVEVEVAHGTAPPKMLL